MFGARPNAGAEIISACMCEPKFLARRVSTEPHSPSRLAIRKQTWQQYGHVARGRRRHPRLRPTVVDQWRRSLAIPKTAPTTAAFLPQRARRTSPRLYRRSDSPSARPPAVPLEKTRLLIGAHALPRRLLVRRQRIFPKRAGITGGVCNCYALFFSSPSTFCERPNSPTSCDEAQKVESPAPASFTQPGATGMLRRQARFLPYSH